MFDAEAWLLLPGKDTIKRYHEMKDEPQYLLSLEVCFLFLAPSVLVVADKNGQKECSMYTYTPIAMHDMTNVPIHVQHNKPSAPEDRGIINVITGNEESSSNNIDFNLEDAFTAYTFPFHQFLEFHPHIHPLIRIKPV